MGSEMCIRDRIYEPFVKAEGLCSDSSPVVTIGTDGQEVKSIEVKFLSGQTQVFDAPQLGTMLECRLQPSE